MSGIWSFPELFVARLLNFDFSKLLDFQSCHAIAVAIRGLLLQVKTCLLAVWMVQSRPCLEGNPVCWQRPGLWFWLFKAFNSMI